VGVGVVANSTAGPGGYSMSVAAARWPAASLARHDHRHARPGPGSAEQRAGVSSERGQGGKAEGEGEQRGARMSEASTST
jgi:hypothetical protein